MTDRARLSEPGRAPGAAPEQTSSCCPKRIWRLRNCTPARVEHNRQVHPVSAGFASGLPRQMSQWPRSSKWVTRKGFASFQNLNLPITSATGSFRSYGKPGRDQEFLWQSMTTYRRSTRCKHQAARRKCPYRGRVKDRRWKWSRDSMKHVTNGVGSAVRSAPPITAW